MKDEIKEILDRLDYNEWEVDLYKVPITWSELYNIRDYITNLQKELKEYKMIFDAFSERPYAHRYLEEKKKELGNNKIIGLDSEMIYKDYYDLQEENERLLKTQEMYEKKCNKIHQYITQNCEIIRHKDYDEIGKVNGGHILFLLKGSDEE
jgi:hypothetical protein